MESKNCKRVEGQRKILRGDEENARESNDEEHERSHRVFPSLQRYQTTSDCENYMPKKFMQAAEEKKRLKRCGKVLTLCRSRSSGGAEIIWSADSEHF